MTMSRRTQAALKNHRFRLDDRARVPIAPQPGISRAVVPGSMTLTIKTVDRETRAMIDAALAKPRKK